jgi:hypothetical protein
MAAPPFRLAALTSSRLLDVNSLWDVIDFEPVYQRQSDVWSVEKRQLFVDSLINGFDIPKLYFHDVSWNPDSDAKRYAIIDGKQRLEAIHAFIEGAFALSDEFEDLATEDTSAANRRYAELGQTHTLLKSQFENFDLPIVVVQTQDYELIDEMFSRLNEAVPLNAPEKRNAFGGPMPAQIRRLVKHRVFSSEMAFPNARYRHLDLATKFLYIEHRGGLTDLKKRDLDEFVRSFKVGDRRDEAQALYEQASRTLDAMEPIFLPGDPLLTSVGMITIYYQLVREALIEDWLGSVTREVLVEFDNARVLNRGLVRETQELALEGKSSPASALISDVLVAFERYVQSPNDVRALTQRFQVLRYFVLHGQVPAGN